MPVTATDYYVQAATRYVSMISVISAVLIYFLFYNIFSDSYLFHFCSNFQYLVVLCF